MSAWARLTIGVSGAGPMTFDLGLKRRPGIHCTPLASCRVHFLANFPANGDDEDEKNSENQRALDYQKDWDANALWKQRQADSDDSNQKEQVPELDSAT